MNLWHALVLGVIQGITEFLPVSSTAHLTAASNLMGYQIDDRGITAFTAIIQVGTILAVVGYFFRDIVTLLSAWFRGLFHKEARGPEYRMAWIVVIGSIPIGLVGFLARDFIAGALRNMWVIVGSLVIWSIVLWFAERFGRQYRFQPDLTMNDGIFVGLFQCLALIPGISRSGATISAGLFRGLNRVTATRLSFLLGIPALLAAGLFEAIGSRNDITGVGGPGWTATIVATVVSGLVGWAAIAWLLRLGATDPTSAVLLGRVIVPAPLALVLC
ncbi:MAG: undecaprenyl-diphosphate phosphatase, partial [Promicromonosporaceae bacterium]|nr:undecaprenyl-diphosphate phosphatase [Promicromonosporaceae bacterium]